MINDLISICIPTYNAVNYIEETIECFLKQTYKNIEIIIQDDCSTDGTWQLINEKYCNNVKIKLYRNKINLGIGRNWNKAYEKVSGKYVVIANADDIFFPTFLETGIKNIINSGANFCSFKYKLYFEKDRSSTYTNANKSINENYFKNAFAQIFFENPFSIVFTIFEKEKLDKIKYNNNLFLPTQVCDYELMMRYSYRFNLYYSAEIAGFYRIHHSNNSANPLSETKSFFYDILPIWDERLKQMYGRKYTTKMRSFLINYLKDVIKLRSPFNAKLLKSMLKYAF